MRFLPWWGEHRLVLGFFDLEHLCAEFQHILVRQVVIKRHNSSWRCFVKGTKDGMAVIAFFRHRTYGELLLNVAELLQTDAVYWHRDKYP